MRGQGGRGVVFRGGGEPIAAASTKPGEAASAEQSARGRGGFSAGAAELLSRQMSYGATLRPAAIEDFGIEDGEETASALKFA
jgi:hypothetical protein